MAPFLVQIVATSLARPFVPWRDAARLGIAIMFMFTAAAHFTAVKYDLAAMIPPPLTGSLRVIYLSGLLEIAGAIGLLTNRWRRRAAASLIALLVLMFPANVYAALHDVPLRGSSPTPLLVRAPLQLFWIGVLWWSTLARGAAPTRGW